MIKTGRVVVLVLACAACSTHCNGPSDSAAVPSATPDASPSADASSDATAPRSGTWGFDHALSSAGANVELNYNFGRSVATDGASTVYAVWGDTQGGVSRVKLARSRDSGVTWEPEQTLSADGVSAKHPTIAAVGAKVHVAWEQTIFGQMSVTTRRSDDRSATWRAAVDLTKQVVVSSVTIAASGSRTRVVYTAGADAGAEVYTRGSSDDGETWDAEQRISEAQYASWVPTVELDGDRAYVAWVDYKDANEEEYFRASSDGGLHWGPVVRLTNDAADSWAGSLVVGKGSLHYAWFDRRAAGYLETDLESQFDQAAALVGAVVAPAPPRDPGTYYLDILGGRFYAKQAAIQAAAPGWIAGGGSAAQLQTLLDEFARRYEKWTNGWAIYTKRSDDGGATWTDDARVTVAEGPQMRPSLVYSNDALHMVWFDGRGAGRPSNVYYKASHDGGRTWEPERLLTSAPTPKFDGSTRPSIAAADGTLHVVWSDGRGQSPAAFYERFGP